MGCALCAARYLQDNALHEVGVAPLVPALSALTGLTQLSLGGNDIEWDKLQHLASHCRPTVCDGFQTFDLCLSF